MGKIRVVISFHHFPCAIGRYFERALRRRDDVDLITVGPAYGRWIPWNGGMYLPEKYASDPHIVIPSPNTQIVSVPIRMIEARIEAFRPGWIPDLWLQVDGGIFLEGKPRHGVNAIVGTDPHVGTLGNPHYMYDAQRRDADVFFNMQLRYAKSGDEYLPYAYDPTVHYPEQLDKEWDVVICGLQYPQRQQVAHELQVWGKRVWSGIGPIFDEYRQLHCRSRVGFNWSSMEDLNARAFELLAMGLPTVMNHVPDMDLFFKPGGDYLNFTKGADAVSFISVLLEEERLRDKVSEAGRAAVQPHTWDARVERIFERCLGQTKKAA